MDTDWDRIKSIFADAVALPAESRELYLAHECNGNDALSAEIRSLLAAADEPDNLIENNALDLNSTLATERKTYANKHFGNYRIIREIGSGGMGAVFLADRDDGEFTHQVALKIVRQSVADRNIIERFRSERQILANLNHPNIAVLHDGGISDKGEPFLVMEYVDGTTLMEYCEQNQLEIPELLHLFLKVCSAVAYAHRNLVVHRDIKPSNILVTTSGEPKLLDFGLAKAFESDTSKTQTALRAFTPAYASPEQIEGGIITTASDVYSLGVVFYELLTGIKPLSFENCSYEEIIETIRNAEPARPSAVSIPGKSHLLNQGRHGDLDNIALTALRKEPDRRYASVEDFAKDIELHLAGRPVSARPNTFSYRAGKFVKRNKIIVAAALIILISLVTGAAFASWQATVARNERDRARLEAEKSARVSEFLQKLMLTASPNWNSPGFGKSSDVTLIEVIDEAAQRVDTEFAEQPESLAKMHHSLGLVYTYRGRYDEGEMQLRAAFETSRNLYGEENPETLQHARDLAAVLMLRGDYAEADALFQKALITYHTLLDGGNKERNTSIGLAGTLSDVGFLLRLKGEPQAAEPFLLESLRQSQDFTGGERAVVAIPLAHLGMARYDQGDLDGAEKYVRQSLAEFQSLPGNTRMESGRSLLNLASVLTARGDYVQAEIQLRSCLELYHRLLGDEHPYTTNALSQLGELQRLKGDYASAQETTATALAVYRRTMPATYPNLAYTLTTLGLILATHDQFASSEKNLREALAIRGRVMREDFWLVAETKGALGQALLDQKKFVEAEPLIRQSYASLLMSQKTENGRVKLAKARLDSLEAALARNRPN